MILYPPSFANRSDRCRHFLSSILGLNIVWPSIEGVGCLWSTDIRRGNISTCTPIHFMYSKPFPSVLVPSLHHCTISDNCSTIYRYVCLVRCVDVQLYHRSNWESQFTVDHYHQIISHDCYKTLRIITHIIHDILLLNFLELIFMFLNEYQIERFYLFFSLVIKKLHPYLLFLIITSNVEVFVVSFHIIPFLVHPVL